MPSEESLTRTFPPSRLGRRGYEEQVVRELLRRAEILNEAEQYSDMILEEVHARAHEAAMSALDSAPPQPEDDRAVAQAELAYLSTYSDVYLAHLRAYTEGLLRGIEEWERRERSRSRTPP